MEDVEKGLFEQKVLTDENVDRGLGGQELWAENEDRGLRLLRLLGRLEQKIKKNF